MRTRSFDGVLAPGVAMTPVKQVAAMHSRGKDIKILFGSECKTDGNTVWLPDISEKADPFYIKMLLHGMYHEVSHVHNSNFIKLRKWINKRRPITVFEKKLLHMCGNSLEDVRIEAIVCEQYPGVNTRMYDFLKQFVERDINKRMADPQVPLIKKLLDTCYLRGRELQYLEQGREAIGLVVPDYVEAVYKDACGSIVLKTSKTRSQETIFKLAEELFKNLKELAEEQEPDEGGSGSEPPQPLAEGDVVRLKKSKDKYGIVTKILGNKEFEVKEVTKAEARAHLKGE